MIIDKSTFDKKVTFAISHTSCVSDISEMLDRLPCVFTPYRQYPSFITTPPRNETNIITQNDALYMLTQKIINQYVRHSTHLLTDSYNKHYQKGALVILVTTFW